ncbi:MAG: hypothetical protein HYY93_15915 [Planctomycetes bacterium]|nr:hypothetical protein [Planctomycetota bacterium]
MNHLVCDRCGRNLLVGEAVRYEVRIEVKAAYDPLELTSDDLRGDLRAEMRRLIARMEGEDPAELERAVYQVLDRDLCMACRRSWTADPLGRSSD